MVLFAIALAALPGTVSFESDAIRVDALVADLARQSGTRLACDVVVASEPVVVQFRDQPLDDVLAHLATVVGAEWERSRDELRLTRTSALRLAQEKEEAQRIEKAITQLVESAAKVVAEARPFDLREAERMTDPYRLANAHEAAQELEGQRMAGTNPSAKMVARVLQSMKASDLAKLRIGGRLVLSDSPTPMQAALPMGAMPALEELKREVRLLMQAKERVEERSSRTYGRGLPQVGPGTFDAGYGKVLVDVRRTSLARFNVSVTMVGRDGLSWVHHRTQLPFDYSMPVPPVYQNKGPKLVLSETAQTFTTLRNHVGYAYAMSTGGSHPAGWASLAFTRAETEGKPPDLGLSGVLADPVARDPIGIALGPSLRQVASAKDRMLLASVSDATVLEAFGWPSPSMVQTHDDLMDSLTQARVAESERFPRAEVKETGRWLLVTPCLRVLARTQRVNRSALKALQDAIRDQGTVRIADAARYLERTRMPVTSGALDMLYLKHFEPRLDPTALGLLSSPALPFVASLSPQAVQALEAGSLVRDLPPALQAQVRQWVYETDGSSGWGPGESSPLLAEPTERFPTGLPAEAKVRIERMEIPAVIARAESGHHFFMNLNSLGLFESRAARGVPQGVPVERKIVGYRQASQVTYVLTLTLPGAPDRTYGFVETLALPGTREGKREDLPSSVQEQIDQARGHYERIVG